MQSLWHRSCSDGLKYILENLTVENLVISKQKESYKNFENIMEIAQKRRVNIIVVKAGDKIEFDQKSYAKILYPTKELPHDDINNNSIVAKFICDGTRIMFTRRYRKRSRRKYTKTI